MKNEKEKKNEKKIKLNKYSRKQISGGKAN